MFDFKEVIKFVYFDVGDVLLDRTIVNDSEVYAKVLGVEVVVIEDILNDLYKSVNPEARFIIEMYDSMRTIKDETEYFTFKHLYLLRRLGIKNDEYILLKKLNDAFFWYTYYQSNLIEGAKDILIYLKNQNYNLGILSNGFPGRREFDLKQQGIADYFETFIISREVGLKKPESEIFVLAARETSHSPENIGFVDDRLENLLVAQQMGFGALFWLCKKENGDEIPKDIIKIRKLTQLKEYL
jgi:putative hydrolase of the HAD superfamily